MPARPSPVGLESLEPRDTPAYTSALSGVTATLTGDGAADTLVISTSGGLLRHNRDTAGDPLFNSDFDWNTAVAGDQTLAASAASAVAISTMGGGDDTLQLGTAAAPARTLLAHVTVSAGGAGNDALVVDNSGSAAADTYDYTSTQTTAPGLNFTNLAVFENGELYRCGTGADTFTVRSTVNTLTIQGTNGADAVTVGDAGGMQSVSGQVSVRNSFALSKLTLDDAADASGDTVTISTAAGQTTVAGLSAGSVVYDQEDVSALTVNAGTGDDVFNWNTTDTGLTATVRGGDGKDSFIVNSAGGVGTLLTLVGQGGDDAFGVNTVPTAGFSVAVIGGGGTDRVDLAAPGGGSPVVTHAGVGSGSATPAVGLLPVQFETVEGVSFFGPLANVTVNLPAAPNPDVVVGDDGTPADVDGAQNAGISFVSGSTFTPTEFTNPTGTLTVNLGAGGDSVTLGAVDPAFAGTVTLNGGAAADTFTITPGAFPVTANGNAPTAAPGDGLFIPVVVPRGTATAPAGTIGSLAYAGMEAVRRAAAEREFSAGADRAAGTVRFFDPDGTERFALTPFGVGFTGGVRVASADFNGDGVADVVAGTGPGGPTKVTVFDGVSKAELFTLAPFEAAFTGGVYVAAGDITGDGVPELVITPDEGGGPRVKVITGAGFTPLADFFGIDDPNFRGGARAAVGDVDGDGFGELVVAAGFGGGPRVAVFAGKMLSATGGPKLLNDLFLFEPALRNGAFVAVGDVNGDGFGDLVGGGGPGGAPRVLALSGADLTAGKGDGAAVLANFFAGDTTSRSGIRVAARRLDADAADDLVVGAGSGAGSRVTAYLGKNLTPGGTPPEALALDAFPGFAGGVYVG